MLPHCTASSSFHTSFCFASLRHLPLPPPISKVAGLVSARPNVTVLCAGGNPPPLLTLGCLISRQPCAQSTLSIAKSSRTPLVESALSSNWTMRGIPSVAARLPRSLHWAPRQSSLPARVYFDLQQPLAALPAAFAMFLPDGTSPMLTAADLWPPAVLPRSTVGPSSTPLHQFSVPSSSTSLVPGHSGAHPAASTNVSSVVAHPDRLSPPSPDSGSTTGLHDATVAVATPPHTSELDVGAGTSRKRRRA